MTAQPKIISLGYAVPEHSYSQEQVFEALAYPRHFWRIFQGSGIEKRHFAVPLASLRKLSFQEQQETYQRAAIELSKQAVINCLDGRDPREVGLFISNTCTGYLPGPVLGHYLAREFNFSPDIHIVSNAGMGCDGAFPGLRTASDFTRSTDKSAMALAIELCSLTYFPEPDGKPDPKNHWELVRSNAIFADACSCVLLGSDHNPNHPLILANETHLDTDYMDDLGFTWQNGRLRVVLSRRVPDIASNLATVIVRKTLAKHQLKQGDIEYWVVHAAGTAVLDGIRDKLGLDEESLALSKEVLRNFGNCSSTTTGIIGKMLMLREKEPRGYCAVIGIGPGVTADMALLKFGEC